ncbi:MAG: hypothetical protein RR371_04285 [Bacteroides sp.]
MLSTKKATQLTEKSVKQRTNNMLAEIESNIVAACNQGKHILRYRFMGDPIAATEIFKPFIMPELLKQGYRVSVGTDSLTEIATIEWR